MMSNGIPILRSGNARQSQRISILWTGHSVHGRIELEDGGVTEIVEEMPHVLPECDIESWAETLILVDESDREVGHASRARCHEGSGLLHRAFSLFIFNDRGELLVQQRSAAKRLWPLYWSNSCCSHPRRAEQTDGAAHRRLFEELGLKCPLHFLFKFKYQAQFDGTGAEHELCSVYIGRSAAPVHADLGEVAAWRWVAPDTLDEQMRLASARFTPWFTLEWQRIRREHQSAVGALQGR